MVRNMRKNYNYPVPLYKTNAMLKHLYFFTVFACLGLVTVAQPPAGYYDNTSSLSGEALKEALHQVIDNHTTLSYSALWGAFDETDQHPNGYVWDMYSDVPDGTPPYTFTFFSEQCGNYGGENDCYNREHSFPKSWFNDASPMYTDLFHLYPTDGFVNGRRGNYPYGETDNPHWTSQNGSKVGNSDFPGYTGTVFEPIDEYKGDFARTYFYMATRYHNIFQNFSSPMLSNTQYPGFTEWALQLLLTWHQQDTVSTKEINRNNAVYAKQGNRNPFIDHPDFAERIWSDDNQLYFTSEPVTQITAGQPYTYTITYNAPSGETPALVDSILPDWLTLSAPAAVTTLTGTPTAANLGTNEVLLVLFTSEDTVYQEFNIVVLPAGDTTAPGGMETFTLMPASSSAYASRTWTGDNSGTWTATAARTDQEIDGRAICLDDDATAKITAPVVEKKITAIAFTHQQKFTGSGGALQLFINGVPYGDAVSVTTAVARDSIPVTNAPENAAFALQSNGGARMAVDNVSWYTETTPTNTSPVITGIFHQPDTVFVSEPATFGARMFDADGPLASAYLELGKTPQTFLAQHYLSPMEGDTFAITITIPDGTDSLYYRFVATDMQFNKTISETLALPVRARIVPTIANRRNLQVRYYVNEQRALVIQPPGHLQATIITIGGRVVDQFEAATSTERPMHHLPTGIYLLHLQNKETSVVHKIMLK